MRNRTDQCFNYLGDIGDDIGGNRHRAMPWWFTPEAQAETPAENTVATPPETPPRLVTLLNATPVPSYTTSPLYSTAKTNKGADLNFAAPGEIEVGFLLQHIYERLSRSFIGSNGESNAESPWGVSAQVDRDEHWARRIAEMLTLLPYTIPATGYGYLAPHGLGDGNMMSKLLDNDDPAWPLVMECQHTVSTAVITRGYAIPKATPQTGRLPSLVGSNLFGAAISSTQAAALTLRGGNGGNAQTAGKVQWLDAATAGNSLSGFPALFGPGSSLVFNSSANGSTQEPSASPHTAFVIRIKRDHAQKIQAIQYFDVGGMNVPDTPQISATMTSLARISHAFECPWSTTGKAGAAGNFRGMTALGTDEASLKTALDAARITRPLGFARLVLAKRNKPDGTPYNIIKNDPKEWLLYASPLVRMWEDDAEKNYAPVRFAWSLRDMPGAADITAYWMISIPRGKLAECVLFGINNLPSSRTTSLADLVKSADPASKPQKSLTAQGPILGIIDFCVMADGKVAVADCCKSSASSTEPPFVFVARDVPSAAAGGVAIRALPWGKATGSTNVDVTKLSGIPAYFAEVPDPADGA